MSKCVTCAQLKADHQQPYIELQQLEIPEWKWDKIMMDFVTKLPKTSRGNNLIQVILDQFTKSTHFLATKENQKLEKHEKMYVEEIITQHGMPLSMILDRDSQFTSRFQPKLQEELGTRVHLSTAYHPQTDAQNDRTIKTLE